MSLKHKEERRHLSEERSGLQKKFSAARKEVEAVKEDLQLSRRDVEVLRGRLREAEAKLKETAMAGGATRRAMSDRTNVNGFVPTVTRPSIPSTARYSYEAFSNLRGEDSKQT